MDQKALVPLILALLFAGCATEEGSSNVNIEDLRTAPIERVFTYSMADASGEIEMMLYSGLNDYLANLSRTYPCRPICPSQEDIHRLYLSNRLQEEELLQIVYIIQAKSVDESKQVRAAISMVQRIPYDTESYERRDNRDRYPYQVLYENKGVCDEKTRLLAYILKNMGYGVAILSFQKEQHSVLGLKCLPEHSYGNTGYCFIEASSPAIPTYSGGEYAGSGRLSSEPVVMKLSEGKTYALMGEEFYDAQEWDRLNQLILRGGGVLSQEDYDRWMGLAGKYGIPSS